MAEFRAALEAGRAAFPASRRLDLDSGDGRANPGFRRGEQACRSAARSAASRCSTIRMTCYAGDVGIGINPKLAQRVREADLVVAIGARLGEVTTGGYTLFDIPVPKQKLIHVYPDPEELGRVYRPILAIAASSRDFAAALAAMQPIATPRWAGRHRRGACRLSCLSHAGRKSRRGADERDRRLARRACSGGHDLRQRRRQFRHLGSSLPLLSRLRHATWRRPAARWAMACRPRSRRRCATPIAPCCASPATAIS